MLITIIFLFILTVVGLLFPLLVYQKFQTLKRDLIVLSNDFHLLRKQTINTFYKLSTIIDDRFLDDGK